MALLRGHGCDDLQGPLAERLLAKRMATRLRRRRFAEDRRLLRDMSEEDLLDLGMGRSEVNYITDPASQEE